MRVAPSLCDAVAPPHTHLPSTRCAQSMIVLPALILGVLHSKCPAPGFRDMDTFNTRAPMAVADALSQLTANKSFLEIGTRKGDIFACVAHSARKTIVVEAFGGYCKNIVQRSKPLGVVVRCPERFPTKGTLDADIMFTWMPPQLTFSILQEVLRNMKKGLISPSSKFLTLIFPLSVYKATRALPISVWSELDLLRHASSVYAVPFRERAVIMSNGVGSLQVDGTAFLAEFDLPRSTHLLELKLTNRKCRSATWSEDKCPTPHFLRNVTAAMSGLSLQCESSRWPEGCVWRSRS